MTRNTDAAPVRAIGRALAARRTCPACGSEKDYCLPRSTGQCNDCADGGTR